MKKLNLQKRLKRISELPEKKPHYSKGTAEASYDKNGVYFKIGQKIINHGHGSEWINDEQDIIDFNVKIKSYYYLEVVA